MGFVTVIQYVTNIFQNRKPTNNGDTQRAGAR